MPEKGKRSKKDWERARGKMRGKMRGERDGERERKTEEREEYAGVGCPWIGLFCSGPISFVLFVCWHQRAASHSPC